MWEKIIQFGDEFQTHSDKYFGQNLRKKSDTSKEEQFQTKLKKYFRQILRKNSDKSWELSQTNPKKGYRQILGRISDESWEGFSKVHDFRQILERISNESLEKFQTKPEEHLRNSEKCFNETRRKCLR